jgi:hypothetical protein
MQSNHTDDDNNMSTAAKVAAVGALVAGAAAAAVVATNSDVREKLEDGVDAVTEKFRDVINGGTLARLRAEFEDFVESTNLDELGEKVQASVMKRYEDLRAKFDELAQDAEGNADDLFEDVRTAWEKLQADVKEDLKNKIDAA